MAIISPVIAGWEHAAVPSAALRSGTAIISQAQGKVRQRPSRTTGYVVARGAVPDLASRTCARKGAAAKRWDYLSVRAEILTCVGRCGLVGGEV